MALKRNLARSDNQTRFEFSNAYFKVVKAEFNTERNKFIIQVKAYGDEGSRRYEEANQNMPMPGMGMNKVVYEKTYEVDPTVVPEPTTALSVKNKMLQSAYIWLKTLSGDFSTASDVLEAGQ